MEEEGMEDQILPGARGGTTGLRTLMRGGRQTRITGLRTLMRGGRQTRITAAVLREMIQEDSATILMQISRPHSGFTEFLNMVDLTVDTTKLALAVIGKACLCESMDENLNVVITNILVTRFLDNTVPRLLHQLQGRGDDDLVKSCLPLLTALLTRMPTEGWQKVQDIAVKVQGIWIQGSMKNEDINKGMTDLIQLMNRSAPPPIDVGAQAGSSEEDIEPPEDFRELDIIPRKDELDGTREITLLPNKIEGGFENLQQYLECQFRLFRADFIFPLKDSIIDYQAVGQDTTKGNNIYTDVQIIRPVCSHNGLGYRVAFDVRPLRGVRWVTSRRLMYGSLLCLSSDKFQDNIFYATVDNTDGNKKQDKDLVRNGLVDVIFLPNQDISSVSRDTRFDMVESQAYFESYKYILRGMHNLTDRNVPFQRYIVHCHKDVGEPLYLRQNPDFTYDLRPLMTPGFRISDDKDEDYAFLASTNIGKDVKVQDISSWPIPELLSLDITQLNALRNALTREFALIQGPPGTGKTYVGVNILKTLLHNSEAWREGRTPILVVCYTNHALDQFLEATLQFFKGKLIRVGSRSKSEQMQEHSLRNARQRVKEMREFPPEIHAGKLTSLREMEKMKATIHTIAAQLEVAEREIVHEKVLTEFMDRDYFPAATVNQPCHILDWLGVAKQLAGVNHKGEEYLQHELEMNQGDIENEEEEEEEEEETVDNATDRQSHRFLDEDDDFDDDSGDRHRTLDADINRVRMKCMGLDVTNLDVSVDLKFMSKEQKETEKEKQKNKKSLKHRLLSRIRSTDRMGHQEVTRVGIIWRLPYKERWRLYRYWTDLLCRKARGEIRDKEAEYRRLSSQYQEYLLQEDRVILQNCSIIGMTTTGAARYQAILNEIGPRIIVVEEAAEVLEAHVIGTLSRECQHLILIGDHKQLRPNPTVHKLAKRYNLEISLFERMVNNGLDCNTLGWQHRMRPEIAEVIRPLYKNLRDHEVVQNYEHIRGVSTNVFFINHQHPHTKDEETKSFHNDYEAKYLVAFCRYLTKQQYNTQRITILTPYSAQMHYIQNLMPKTQFDGVKVVAVDNYQGEENDIVLLSLVRSGEETSIGFLAEDNRICVALSRAKMGLYVIGNFAYITEHSPLMKDICERARRNGVLGADLQLRCQNHPRDGVIVKEPRDFERMPEGGCTKPCEHRLSCGHTCPRMCHPSTDHANIICSKPCRKRCSHCNNVTCTKLCYEECSPCPFLFEKQLPRCNHVQKLECQEDVLFAKCQEKCAEILDCGHPCSGKCSEVHPPCKELVEITMPCEHLVQLECSVKDTAACNSPCDAVLECEHRCRGTCGTCYQGRLHQQCLSDCNRLLICGHECESNCSECPPCRRPCENRCNHSRCSRQCGDPCVICVEDCQWRCRHFKCTAPCGEMCNRKRCNDPCRKKPLSCGHPCIGVCGEPCPKLCRICDEEAVTETFFGGEDEANGLFIELEDCGHIFEMKGLDKWMDGDDEDDKDQEDNGEEPEEQPQVVKLKGCPRCQTPIRRNLRYGNVIKQALADIEKVKRKNLGNKDRIKALKDSIANNKTRLDGQQQHIVNRLLDSFPVPSETILSAQSNQVLVFQQLISLERRVNENSRKFRHSGDAYKALHEQIRNFKRWVMLARSCYSAQEVQDTRREMKRLDMLKELVDAWNWMEEPDDQDVPVRVMRELVAMIRRLETPPMLPDHVIQEAEDIKVQVQEYVPGPGIGISDEEREMVVEAMGLNKGHWYKCKKGHVYAIGECGRPLEEAKCPDCHGAIGGTNHTFAEDNAWAPEMDNAEKPVWSQEQDYMMAVQLQFGDRF